MKYGNPLSIDVYVFVFISLALLEVVGLLDVFSPATSLASFHDVYLVTHLMGADLTNIIRQQALSDDHVQFLVYQILRGLKAREGNGMMTQHVPFLMPG